MGAKVATVTTAAVASQKVQKSGEVEKKKLFLLCCYLFLCTHRATTTKVENYENFCCFRRRRVKYPFLFHSRDFLSVSLFLSVFGVFFCLEENDKLPFPFHLHFLSRQSLFIFILAKKKYTVTI